MEGVLEEVGLEKKNGEDRDGRRGMGTFWVIIMYSLGVFSRKKIGNLEFQPRLHICSN